MGMSCAVTLATIPAQAMCELGKSEQKGYITPLFAETPEGCRAVRAGNANSG
jgi:hypothetical protein